MQVNALEIINLLGNEATPLALARVMFRETPTISSLLGRMTAQGLILKTRTGRRGGLIRLTLPDKGQQALGDTLARESLERVMNGLPVRDRRALLAALVPLKSLALEDLGLAPDGEKQGSVT